MINSSIVLLPPLIVFIGALYTRNVIISLALGILCAAYIATGYDITNTLSLTSQKIFYAALDPDHLYTFIFLLLLGIVIQLLTHVGGIAAYTRAIRSYLKNARDVQMASLILSCTFFIDDYLNSLTVGSIMRPLTDHFYIPRAKLAFLLNSMSSSLCVLVPATSWVAMILMQLQISGVSNTPNSLILTDPFNAYLHMIPFMFYPFLSIFSAWFIVPLNISFGIMHSYEKIAHSTKNLFGGKPPLALHEVHPSQTHTGSLSDFMIPISTFMISIAASLLYTGNFYVFGGDRSFFLALQHSDIFISLFLGTLFTLIVCIIMFRIKHKLSVQQLGELSLSGINLMKNSLFLLLLAWTFTSLLKDDLHTGEYLAHILIGTIPLFLLPFMFFVTSTIVSASTGSAWGTIAIMIPLGIPMIIEFTHTITPGLIDTIPIFFPAIGAIISGAVAGGHLSPIADSMVLASTSAGAYHLDTAAAQITYALPSLAGALAAFFIAGLLLPLTGPLASSISLVSGLIITGIILLLCNQKK